MVDEATLGSGISFGGFSTSGSSGMVSRERGRAELAVVLLVSLFGDWVTAAGVVRVVEEVGLRLLVGLAVLVRGVERVEGRLGGTEVDAPPNVVRLVLSELGSGRAVLEPVPPRVVVRDKGRLFSSPAAAVDGASSVLVAGLRWEDVAGGRVGGLLMVLPEVLPEVREERVVGRTAEGDAVERAVEDDAGVRVVVLKRDDAVEGFFASSAFAGAFAPGVLLCLSMLLLCPLLFTPRLLPTRR